MRNAPLKAFASPLQSKPTKDKVKKKEPVTVPRKPKK